MTRALVCLALLGMTATAAARNLVGVYEDALRNDPQIRQADANRLASREARPQAWSAVLPQLAGAASRTQDKQDGTQGTLTFDPNTNTYIPIAEAYNLNSTARTWSLNLRQNLFSWSNWMTLRQADSQVAQAEATYQAAQQSLILRVAQAYFNVLAAQDGLEANQASLEAISRQLDQANKRFEVGLIAITDVQEAKAARDTAAAAVIAAKRTLATAGDQLSEITGQKYELLSKPGEDMPLNSPQPADEDKWVQVSLDQNLSLISSRLAADIARDNVRIAFGGHLPTIDLIASKSRTTTDADEAVPPLGPFSLDSVINDRQYTLQITVPLFSGGLTQSKVRQSQYLWIAAKEQVTQSSRATERQARDAYLGVISGIARVQALRQALESSQTALKATEAGYEVGTRTAVDVLNSRRTLVQAQTDYAGSRYDYIVSVIQLRLAAGNLSRNDVEEINKWLAVTAPTVPAQPIEAPEQPSAPQAPPSTP
ncbi:MAG TPA: TolC family outer membrane protein [Steroidobacteraceae bacterium]|nr:TolC family outer membrane protein [Steroidobacteraceae bacterium]